MSFCVDVTLPLDKDVERCPVPVKTMEKSIKVGKDLERRAENFE